MKKTLRTFMAVLVLSGLAPNLRAGSNKTLEKVAALTPLEKIGKELLDVPNIHKHENKKIQILIDPGHGGEDKGAKGFGLQEKNLCLNVSKLVKSELERMSRILKMPVEIKLSREKDEFISLNRRTEIANDWGADLFVSIHANASLSNRAKGFELYFMSTEASDKHTRALVKLENLNEGESPLKSDVLSILSDVRKNQHIVESSKFAEVMYQSMSQYVRPNVRGVRQGPFTVLSGTAMPAVLVEIGYLTHQDDALLLKKSSYIKNLSSAISSGILDYLNLSKS